ncbi:MAG TPA: ABC transporter ATP-binding protein, partial [Anaerolineales bacterium]|nr:ABC transporter ATP-binding protein [Anaerolineales bacterium]
QSYKVNVQRGFVLSLVFPTLNALGGIFTAILIYVGGLSAAQGIVTVGAWYLFIMSLDQFFFPVLNLSAFWAQIQAGLSAAERAFALIDADPNVVQTDHKDVPRLKGHIQFDDLHFRYTDNEPILTHFNLTIQPGENIAFVGHTGAGKSSIAKLMARFYEYQQGRLLIDGQDIRTFDLAQYRRQLGIVSQVPFLFSGTVADNIRYAAPEATDAEMLEMARKIGDGEWLETLPNGIETEVGERGARLSMGQRQLVALMRVLMQNPAIFILDEATASIDPFTEWQIQQALNLILRNSTSILIAHRLSTVKAANRIVVMDRGRIIEEGNHDGLLAQGGHYAMLYNTYFRHQSLDYRPSWQEEPLDIKHGDD